jgi:hypothetical protein
MEINSTAPYALLAVSFAEALVAGEFQHAHGLLDATLQATSSPDVLRQKFEQMIAYADAPATSVELVVTMEDWPLRQPSDVGWAYVAIEGSGFSEAVTLIVTESSSGLRILRIREIEWGRP